MKNPATPFAFFSWVRPPRVSTLFHKIFLVFWFAMTLAGIVLLAIETERTARLAQRWQNVTGDVFAVYASSAAEDHEDEETWEVKEFLADMERRTGIRAWLFDRQGREVSGYAPAPHAAYPAWMVVEMQRLMERAHRSGQTELAPLGDITLAAHAAQAPSNGAVLR